MVSQENMKSFKEKVLSVVKKIPRGETLSYKEVAKRAGNPKASRAVGAILKTNFNPKIPCHRVIRSDACLPAGRGLGGYNRGVKQKIKLLHKVKAV